MTTDIARLRKLATPYEGYYVDSAGDVWSSVPWRGRTWHKLTPHPNGHGYPAVKLRIGHKMKKALVHKLVCMAFHGPAPSRVHEVRHLDGNRSNCCEGNLCWGTRAENAADRKSHGTEMAADNGRRSALKLRGRYAPLCRRGHDKQGRRSCEQCRREARSGAHGSL
jgi:hypothetical protein